MLTPLILEATNDTPEVVLDPAGNKFQFSGRSLPENARDFYLPLFEWFDSYIQQPNPLTTLEVNMFYFNTSSSKMLMDIFFKLENLHKAGHEVKIVWYCDEDDEDMVEMGEEFAEMVDVPVKIVFNPE